MNDDSIKLMSLLEELEDLITSSSKMPFSEKGIIDLDVATKILEDIRANLPRDIQQAKWLDQERDRIISDAKREYNRMINEAKDQVEYLVNNNNIYKDAQRRADAILKEAENHANYMKYSDGILQSDVLQHQRKGEPEPSGDEDSRGKSSSWRSA